MFAVKRDIRSDASRPKSVRNCPRARSASLLTQPPRGGENTGVLLRSDQATETRLRKQTPTIVWLALGHDGLWVFANRILANWIFAHRILADRRRRRRRWLLTRQISGSGNAQHGDEPSPYDYDGLHDANPLVCPSPPTSYRGTPLVAPSGRTVSPLRISDPSQSTTSGAT